MQLGMFICTLVKIMGLHFSYYLRSYPEQQVLFSLEESVETGLSDFQLCLSPH